MCGGRLVLVHFTWSNLGIVEAGQCIASQFWFTSHYYCLFTTKAAFTNFADVLTSFFFFFFKRGVHFVFLQTRCRLLYHILHLTLNNFYKLITLTVLYIHVSKWVIIVTLHLHLLIVHTMSHWLTCLPTFFCLVFCHVFLVHIFLHANMQSYLSWSPWPCVPF